MELRKSNFHCKFLTDNNWWEFTSRLTCLYRLLIESFMRLDTNSAIARSFVSYWFEPLKLLMFDDAKWKTWWTLWTELICNNSIQSIENTIIVERSFMHKFHFTASCRKFASWKFEESEMKFMKFSIVVVTNNVRASSSSLVWWSKF